MQSTSERSQRRPALEELHAIESAQRAIERELSRGLKTLKRYIAGRGEHEAFLGLMRSPEPRHGEPSSPTGTAFALGTLRHVQLLDQAFDAEAIIQLSDYLDSEAEKFIKDWVPPLEDAEAKPRKAVTALAIKQTTAHRFDHIRVPPPASRSTDPGPRNNQYSVPTRLAGYLQQRWFLGAVGEFPDHVRGALGRIAGELKENRGFLKRVAGMQPDTPSAYFTLWAVSCLILAEKANPAATSDQFNVELTLARNWASSNLEKLIAGRSVKSIAHFDVVECISAACIAGLLTKVSRERVADSIDPQYPLQLAEHAIELVLDDYFSGSSFFISRPVFASDRHDATLCSTAEALFYILNCFPKPSYLRMLTSRWEKIVAVAQWASLRFSANGYPPDVDAAFSAEPVSNIFSTTSTLGFLARLKDVLDDIKNHIARQELNIGAEAPDSSFLRSVYKYPTGIATSLQRNTINRIDAGERRTASLSFILHGPPGTSKTTFAEKLAHDLGWPLKIITQSDFLRKGRDLIDTEAERMFSVCAYLKDVVVLFDELEELILARDVVPSVAIPGVGSGSNETEKESRLLTTSMLPRIQELRKRERIVFIFATNRLGVLDRAATRRGRFDVIFGLNYPNPEIVASEVLSCARRHTELSEKEMNHLVTILKAVPFSTINSSGDDYIHQLRKEASDESKAIADQLGWARLTYKDIEAVVSSLADDLALGGSITIETATKKFVSAQNFTTEEQLRFLRLSLTQDRL